MRTPTIAGSGAGCCSVVASHRIRAFVDSLLASIGQAFGGFLLVIFQASGVHPGCGVAEDGCCFQPPPHKAKPHPCSRRRCGSIELARWVATLKSAGRIAISSGQLRLPVRDRFALSQSSMT